MKRTWASLVFFPLILVATACSPLILGGAVGIATSAGGGGGGGGGGASAPVEPPAVAARLQFSVQPGAVELGRPIEPPLRIVVLDDSGQLVATATNVVTLTLDSNPGGGVLTGTLSVAAEGGVATFADLSIDAVGTGYSLRASAAGLPSVTSQSFEVGFVPVSMSFTGQPSTIRAGSVIQPAVRVSLLDELGRLAMTATDLVTLSLDSNPGAGMFSGTSTVAAVGGVAVFTDLSIDAVGVGYTLRATSPGLVGAISQGFDVTDPAVSLRNRRKIRLREKPTRN